MNDVPVALQHRFRKKFVPAVLAFIGDQTDPWARPATIGRDILAANFQTIWDAVFPKHKYRFDGTKDDKRYIIVRCIDGTLAALLLTWL